MEKTIYDVAEAAGVSIATVSKVINGTGKISVKTKMNVERVIKQLNYQPSTIASALTSKRTFTIGVLIPNIANPFFGEVTRIIEKYAREHNYATMICSTYNDSENEIATIKMFLRQQVDGLIIATEQITSDQLVEMNTRNIPIVKFSAFSDSKKTLGISTDNELGGEIAARYLYEMGHREVWLIGETNRHSEQERIKGFCRFFKNNDYPIDKTKIFHSDTEFDGATKVAEEILQHKQLPTAVFVTTDIVAIIVMNVAKRLNIRIPEDLSVVGFDNTVFAQLYQPQLTTISQPVQKMGHQAVKSLIDMIEGKLQEPYEMHYFKPEMIVRETVKRLEG